VTNTNPYCAALGIPVPRVETACSSPDANYYGLLLVALLERGAPLTLEEAAVREVAEETGISGRILASLGTIDYWFSASGTRVHKLVHHYLLEATGGELSIEGDPDAEAIDVAWFSLGDVQSQLTFPNERRIAQVAWERLAGET